MTTQVLTRAAQDYFEERLVWRPGPDQDHPYKAELAREKLLIRLNDFPDRPLYTLIENDNEIADFDDWPKQWVRTETRSKPR